MKKVVAVWGCVLALGLAGLGAPARGAEASDFPVVSTGEAVSLDKKLDRNHAVLFEFFSQTCATCKAIAPSLKTMAAKYPNLTIKKIDIGDGDTPVVSQYNIEATPTFLLYDGNGKLSQRMVTGDVSLVETAVQAALPVGVAASPTPAPKVASKAPVVQNDDLFDDHASKAKTTAKAPVIQEADLTDDEPATKPANKHAAKKPTAKKPVAKVAKKPAAKAKVAAAMPKAPKVAAKPKAPDIVADADDTDSTDAPDVETPKPAAKPAPHKVVHHRRFTYAYHVVPSGYTYVVRDRNTLFGVAVDAMGQGGRWRDIAALNHLSAGQGVRVGTVLRLPK